MIENLLLIVHLVAAVGLVVLVLLQQGKGAQAGAAFGGGGSSQSLFGARGSANFLTHTTSVFAMVFFVTTLSLAYLYAHRSGASSVVSDGSITEQVDQAAKAPVSDVPMVPATTEENTNKSSDTPDVPQVDTPAVPE